MEFSAVILRFADRDARGKVSSEITDLLLAAAAAEDSTWSSDLQRLALESALAHERGLALLRERCGPLIQATRRAFLDGQGDPDSVRLDPRLVAFSLLPEDIARLDRSRRSIDVIAASEDPYCIGMLTELTPPEFVVIPAGTFSQGGGAKPDQLPVRTRWLPTFYMARFPTTASECSQIAEHLGMPTENDSSRGLVPANHLSFAQAARLAAAAGNRLPTEAEWEKAAKGETQWAFPWGETFEAVRANTRELGLGTLTDVDRFSGSGESPYGVTDLIGNAWEWTSSRYAPYGSEARLGSDPRTLTLTGDRVLRGGAFDFDHSVSNNLSRYRSDVDRSWDTHGYRHAATPSEVIS